MKFSIFAGRCFDTAQKQGEPYLQLVYEITMPSTAPPFIYLLVPH